MQRVQECVLQLGVEVASHILLQFLCLQHLVATRSLLKYLVDILQQLWLLVCVRQSVDGEVWLQLTLAVGVRLYGDGPQVYQLQYARRHQVVVVRTAPLVCVHYVVSLLQVALQRYVAIPHQVLVHTLAGTPFAYSAPYTSHDRP